MFEELRKRGLLLEPVPAQYPRTTQSYHNLPVFRNVIKDLEVTARRQDDLRPHRQAVAWR